MMDGIYEPMEMNADLSGAEILALASAVLAVLAAFLPWVTAGVQAGPVDVTASTTGIEGLGVLTVLLAVIAIGGVLVGHGARWAAVVITAAGLAVFLVGGWKILDLGGAASPGIGLYFTLLGGLGIAIGGLWSHRSRSRRSTPGATS